MSVHIFCKIRRHITAEIEEYDWIARKCIEKNCKRRYFGGGRITKTIKHLSLSEYWKEKRKR